MKKQLNKCRSGELKQFGYRLILVSLFLDWVPVLLLQVEWGIPAPQDSRVKRWVDLMARHAAGPIVRYNDVFFDWLRNRMLMVDDYAYVGLKLWGDPDLALPEGCQWGNIGRKDILFL
jgi:hypothetical protein